MTLTWVSRQLVSGSGSNDTYVGAYMASRWAWPNFFWWTQTLGLPSTSALQTYVDA
jgi:hypothetical protein